MVQHDQRRHVPFTSLPEHPVLPRRSESTPLPQISKPWPFDGWIPRAVAFDCDGTLVDTESCWTDAQAELFATRGLIFTPAHELAFHGMALPPRCARIATIFCEPGNAPTIRGELLYLHRQDEDSLKRFRREAEILAKLSHPAIATIHDIGTHDGRPFIVTELLDGTDLGKFISRHPRGMEVREVLDLAMPAAEALSYAHSRGVLHRDIKPGNLMVTGARRARGLRICDFGIASLASATWTLTAPGGFAGNPAYVSPEQLSGLADERSDLYSLGCVLYEMLTGHPPLTADSLVALLLMHVSTIPEPPESLEAIPDAFSALVLRMLAKNPGDRPRSANDVAAELGRIALLMRGLEVQPAERRCS
jgi:serine/threonine protein kinase